MYANDVTQVVIPIYVDQRVAFMKMRQYKQWFRERDIKFSLVYNPAWDTTPTAITLRNEDAIIFKLTFGL